MDAVCSDDQVSLMYSPVGKRNCGVGGIELLHRTSEMKLCGWSFAIGVYRRLPQGSV